LGEATTEIIAERSERAAIFVDSYPKNARSYLEMQCGDERPAFGGFEYEFYDVHLCKSTDNRVTCTTSYMRPRKRSKMTKKSDSWSEDEQWN
jgi:hypothetical protein